MAPSVLGFVLHVLFSPWLLVTVAVVAWIKFRQAATGHKRLHTMGALRRSGLAT